MKRAPETLSDNERSRVINAVKELCPRVLPSSWRTGERFPNARWYFSREGLRVLLECELHGEELWVHASLSRMDRIPSYEDLQQVKRVFIGRARKAVMIFPAESEHVNIHPHCLHLYAPINRDPMPDFRTEQGEL